MGTSEGAFCNCGRMRMEQVLPLGGILVMMAFAIALGTSSDARAATERPRTTFRFPATGVHGNVVTFELSGIAPESIRSAYVKRGAKKRHLPLGRARAAARRGLLRLRLGRLQPSRHGHRSRVSRHRRSRKRKPTLVIVTRPSPPAPGPVKSWRPAGSPPLSDAAAKRLVVPRAEIRPANAMANHYLPTSFELAAFHRAGSFNPLEKYVSGGFTGTTDEILQWGSHKWGIPEDQFRAAAATESWWRQGGMGDRHDGVNAALYPAQSRIDSDSVYETLGLMQIKWRPDGSLHPGTEPLRWKSTAFSVDYWGATIRYYYDGLCSWCGGSYGRAQAWESIGAHYNPSPWRNAGMLDYIATVKGDLAARVWQRPGF
jgi:hypothetical protein